MAGWRLYGVAGIMFQVLALSACGAPTQEPAPAPTTSPSPQPASAARPPAGPERLVLAFGDSLYAGYGLNRGESLPDRIQEALRADGVNARVVNAGVSGDTTAAGRQRLAFALDNLPRTPDLVMLGLGGNDVLRQISPAETRSNLVAMLEELKRRNIPVVLTGMLAPPNLGPEYARDFNAIYTDLARRYDAVLDPFILAGVLGNAKLMQSDHVHPTAGGVRIIADRLAPIVADRLSQDQSAPTSSR